MNNKESLTFTIEKKATGTFKGMVYATNENISAAQIFFQNEEVQNIVKNQPNKKVPACFLMEGAKKVIEAAIAKGKDRGGVTKNGFNLRWTWQPSICMEGIDNIADLDAETRRVIAEQMLEQGITEGSFTTRINTKYIVELGAPGRDAFNHDSVFGLGVCYPDMGQKSEYELYEDPFHDRECYQFSYFIDLSEMLVTVDLMEHQGQEYYEKIREEITALVEKYSKNHDFTRIKVDTRWGGCSDSDDDFEEYQEDDDW